MGCSGPVQSPPSPKQRQMRAVQSLALQATPSEILYGSLVDPATTDYFLENIVRSRRANLLRSAGPARYGRTLSPASTYLDKAPIAEARHLCTEQISTWSAKRRKQPVHPSTLRPMWTTTAETLGPLQLEKARRVRVSLVVNFRPQTRSHEVQTLREVGNKRLFRHKVLRDSDEFLRTTATWSDVSS